jgi:hypothetical protein
MGGTLGTDTNAPKCDGGTTALIENRPGTPQGAQSDAGSLSRPVKPDNASKSVLKESILRFLADNRAIDRLNFKFKTYNIWPGAYRTDVRNAMQSGNIRFRYLEQSEGAAGVAASYSFEFDIMNIARNFDVGDAYDQSYFIHECTHAYTDKLNLGLQDRFTNEGVAYLAQAIFVKACNQNPIGGLPVYEVARDIADSLASSGAYEVPDADADKLIAQVAGEKSYQDANKKPLYSSGFKAGALETSLRVLDLTTW